MSLFEILRVSIVTVGWSFLIFGSIFIFVRQIIFNKKLNQPILGKIMLTAAAALFITMYSLGVTATLLMFQNLNLGVKVVLPIFIVWFITMLVLIKIIKNWNSEVLIRQEFYNKLTEGIKDIINGDLNFRMPIEKSEHYEIKTNADMFNEMMEELKRRDDFIKETRKREKEINRMKSEFVSISAHQLRTPLSAIKWIFSLLEESEATTKEQDGLIIKGKVSTERMIRLVNDFLNVSRIEEGKFNYNFETISLENIIKIVIEEEENKIKEKNINLIFEEGGKKTKIRGDIEKLYLVFQNFIENAVNYTFKKGNIRVSFAPDKEYLKIIIEDDGVGIPYNQLDKLFQKFTRGSNVIKLQTEGSGLGLFIAKNIIDKHNGHVKIESEEGKGTKVTVSLPRIENGS